MGRVIEKIKYIIFFSAGFFLVTGFFGILIFKYIEKSYVRELYTDSFSILNKTLTEKSKAIENTLFSMERDIKLLAEALEIQDILATQSVFDEYLIIRDVDERARIIVRDIENYIIAHPEMTLKDLQESEEFKSIAIQPVGKREYSALVDFREDIIVLYEDEGFIGPNIDRSEIKEAFPEFYKLQIESKTQEEVYGFYDWKDPDGEIRRKYVRFSRIGVKTADVAELTVGTSAYVDDYKIIPKISPTLEKYLKTFKEDFGYSNILFITPLGYVVYGAEGDLLLGGNLTWKTNKESGLARNYFKVIEKNQPSFFGPFIGVYGDIYPNFSIMTPVFSEEGKKLLGFVAIIDAMDSIFTITEERTDLSNTQETYLVNKDGLLISPVRLHDINMFVQTVRSENVESCFKKTSPERKELKVFLNYRGDGVLGRYHFLSGVEWCVLSEIGEEEAITLPAKKYINGKIPLFVFILASLTFVGFTVGWFVGKRKKNPW